MGAARISETIHAVHFLPGNAGAPGMCFFDPNGSRLDTGFYLEEDGSISVAIDGAKVFGFAGSGTSETFQDGASGSPSIAFTNAPTTGFFKSGSAIGASVGGVLQVQIRAGGLGLMLDTSVLTFGGGNDVVLTRDAANVLALRNGVNAQTFRVYNTFTDASNYEVGVLQWSGNVLQVGTDKAGSGSSRATTFLLGGTAVWSINTSGNLVGGSDNTRDIGAAGATRPRNIYVGSSLFLTAPTAVAAGTYTLLATDNFIVVNNAGTCTVTLGTATAGRSVLIKTVTANTVVSNASNVVPQIGGAAGTAILAATAGKFALLVGDGTNWIIMESN